MKSESLRRKLNGSEWKWFLGSGIVVGVLFNVALQSSPYDLGGLTGGVLSAFLIYLLA
jgi:hypothetical protein